MLKNNMDLLVLPPTENIEEIIKNLSITLTKAYYSTLEFCFDKGIVSILHKGRDLKTFSYIWLSSSWETRDLATAVKIYLENKNVPHSFVEQSTSKITDSMHFVLNNIPYPNTYYIESTNSLEHIASIEQVCGYPLIMKDSKGFGGNGLTYIESREDLIETIKNDKGNRRYIFQTFIPNNYDWGILVAKNKVISAEKSYPLKGEFRNNTCVGAKEIFVDIKNVPQNIKDIAIKASTLLGLEWSRSDIIIEKETEEPFLLEVNRFPGITTESSEVIGATNFVKTFVTN